MRYGIRRRKRISSTFVKQLRRKLEEDSSRPQQILTEPRAGYRLFISKTASDAPADEQLLVLLTEGFFAGFDRFYD